MAAVVYPHLDFGVARHILVELAEVSRNHLRDEGLDFGDDDALDARIDGHGAGGDPRAVPDDEHRPRGRRHQCRQMSQRPLEAHVLRLARRLHFSRGVILQRAVRLPGHRDGGVDAFADINDVAHADPARREPAVRHEPRRHGRHGQGQDHHEPHNHQQQDCRSKPRGRRVRSRQRYQ